MKKILVTFILGCLFMGAQGDRPLMAIDTKTPASQSLTVEDLRQLEAQVKALEREFAGERVKEKKSWFGQYQERRKEERAHQVEKKRILKKEPERVKQEKERRREEKRTGQERRREESGERAKEKKVAKKADAQKNQERQKEERARQVEKKRILEEERERVKQERERRLEEKRAEQERRKKAKEELSREAKRRKNGQEFFESSKQRGDRLYEEAKQLIREKRFKEAKKELEEVDRLDPHRHWVDALLMEVDSRIQRDARREEEERGQRQTGLAKPEVESHGQSPWDDILSEATGSARGLSRRVKTGEQVLPKQSVEKPKPVKREPKKIVEKIVEKKEEQKSEKTKRLQEKREEKRVQNKEKEKSEEKQGTNQAKELLEKGKSLIEAGDYSQANDLLDQALKIDPKLKEAKRYKKIAQRKKKEEARAIYQRVAAKRKSDKKQREEEKEQKQAEKERREAEREKRTQESREGERRAAAEHRIEKEKRQEEERIQKEKQKEAKEEERKQKQAEKERREAEREKEIQESREGEKLVILAEEDLNAREREARQPWSKEAVDPEKEQSLDETASEQERLAREQKRLEEEFLNWKVAKKKPQEKSTYVKKEQEREKTLGDEQRRAEIKKETSKRPEIEKKIEEKKDNSFLIQGGETSLEMKQYDVAIAAYEAALRLRPESSQAQRGIRTAQMAKKEEARKAILAQLDRRQRVVSKPITIYFHDATLAEMLDHLQKMTGANFVIPDEVKQDQDRRTIFIQEAPLEDALQQILEGYKEFTYSVKNQTVSITKPVTAH